MLKIVSWTWMGIFKTKIRTAFKRLYPIPRQRMVMLNTVLLFHLGCDKSHSIGVNFVIDGLQFFNYLLRDEIVEALKGQI